MGSGVDDESVDDADDPGRRPGDVDGGVVLDPGPHVTGERDDALVGSDRQCLGVDPGIAREGLY